MRCCDIFILKREEDDDLWWGANHRQVQRELPNLASWLCKSVPHYYSTGLFLHVPYYHLISWEEENTPLVEKYLNVLQYTFDRVKKGFYCEIFPCIFLALIDPVRASFDRHVKKHPELEFMYKDEQKVHIGVNRQSSLMKVLFKMCEQWVDVACIDIVLCANLELNISDKTYSPYFSVSLFKLCVKGYVQYPIELFGRKISRFILDLDKTCEYFAFLTNLCFAEYDYVTELICYFGRTEYAGELMMNTSSGYW